MKLQSKQEIHQEQGWLYYQPKQGTIKEKSLKFTIDLLLVWFPPKLGNLMIPEEQDQSFQFLILLLASKHLPREEVSLDTKNVSTQKTKPEHVFGRLRPEIKTKKAKSPRSSKSLEGFLTVWDDVLIETRRCTGSLVPYWLGILTWRIIPVSKWLITMVNKSPKDRVVGPLPNGLSKCLINWGDPNHLHVLGWSCK